MKEYPYQNQTLLHGIGFNFARLESILKYGIMSYHEAKKEKIPYIKNYDVNKEHDDYISCVRVGSIPLTNISSKNSAYFVYTCYGINFIIENVSYEENLDGHRILDEVLVKDKVPLNNIKGLAIPKEYLDVPVFGLRIIPRNITKYSYLEEIITNYIAFLNRYGSKISPKDLEIYLIEAFYINKTIANISNKENPEYRELFQEYEDILADLNELLANTTYKTFSKLLKRSVTTFDLVNYFSKGLLPVSDIPYNFFLKTKGISR